VRLLVVGGDRGAERKPSMLNGSPIQLAVPGAAGGCRRPSRSNSNQNRVSTQPPCSTHGGPLVIGTRVRPPPVKQFFSAYGLAAFELGADLKSL
jgi:hypothetical protein